MPRIFRERPIAVSLIIILAGLLITSFVFVYYGLNLGIKPCEGLPSDASNCGDADLGGLVYIFFGVPIALFGIISLLVALVMTYVKPQFNRWYFLRVIYILLLVLIALLSSAFFI